MNKRVVIDDLKVVVIGAGISGLAAAITLHRSGVKKIAILEGDASRNSNELPVKIWPQIVDLVDSRNKSRPSLSVHNWLITCWIIVLPALAGTYLGVKLNKQTITQPEPGGRIRSVQFGSGFVDLGAQWFHGTKNDLCQIAKENGFLHSTNSFEGLGNYYSTGGKVVSANVVKNVSDVIAEALSKLENITSEDDIPESVGEYLTNEFEIYIKKICDTEENVRLKRQVFDWHLRFQVIDNACTDLWTLSAKYFGKYQFCGGDDYVNLKCGFSKVIEHLVSELPPGMLRTSCPVKAIKWKEKASHSSKNICEIVTENDDVYCCEHVMVTCSVGFLKENWSMFDPPLPLVYLKGFNCIGFDTLNKVYLEYDDCWWGPLEGIQFVWDSAKRKKMLEKNEMLWTCDLTGFDPVVGLPNVLVGWVGGEGAVLMEAFSSNIIGQHCTQILREITGNNQIPMPKRCTSSSWYSNKYIRGGYSHLNINKGKCKAVITSLLKPVYSIYENLKHASIFFAGEALHRTCYSTTHGAFESGKEQAMNLINLINSTK